MTVYDHQPPAAALEQNSEHEQPMILEPQRRIRHITSIQVRNLTPFPARDALATALKQPAEQSQFTTHGRLSDDLDLTLKRRRSRRISSTSIGTLNRAFRADAEGEEYVVGDSQSRKRTNSRGSVQSLNPTGIVRKTSLTSSSGTASSTIRANRVRTNSLSSAQSPFSNSTSTGIVQVPSLYMGPSINSQKGLQKVIKSRLVETFITLRIPLDESHVNSGPLPPSTPPPIRGKVAHKRTSSVASTFSTRTGVIGTQGSSLSGHKLTNERPSSPRFSSTEKRTSQTTPSRSSTMVSVKSPSPSHGPKAFPRSPPPTPPPPPKPRDPQTPNYISPFHRPSTNPTFALDSMGADFADWTNLSGERIIISVWGRVGVGWGQADVKGKGKEKDASEKPSASAEDEWKILEEWDVDLSDLVPVPDDLVEHPSHLPSNTLLLTLSPPDQLFYVPAPSCSPSSSRAPSPTTGYTSDPEAGGVHAHMGAKRKIVPADIPLKRGRTRGSRMNAGKTAGFQDLVKLVTLQSVISDTRHSLEAVMRDCDRLIEADEMTFTRREVSEREFWVRTLVERCEAVQEGSAGVRAIIAARREVLLQRRETLALAKQFHIEDLHAQVDQSAEVEIERTLQTSLVSRLTPTRTTLLTTLSSIFPIELLSPPDLLYTILSVPLPIPLGASDPAPPLTLPSHAEVNEDSVASALGYVAQVVQLLAAYLGRLLVYPVTCVGSRSLIKDPISAMMGPRMFPLYSKGMDTYRFEYAVFLLNKDIEILMSDRNLRAMDIRHTLPNLKNLLLTITNGEQAQLSHSRILDSPAPASFDSMMSASLLTPPDLSLESSASSSSSQQATADSSTDHDSSITTLTTTSVTVSLSRKAKPFLGLSPLAGFLRSRYPSSAGRPSVKAVEETPETGIEAGDAAASSSSDAQDADDEEDRRTIRGMSVGTGDIDTEGEAVAHEEAEKPVNGNGHNGSSEREEKHVERPVTPPSVAQTVLH